MGGNGFLHSHLSHSHAINSHSFPFPFPVLWLFPFPFPCSGPKYYKLTSNLCEKTSLLKTAIPELCRFCFILSCSVSKKHYSAYNRQCSGAVYNKYCISRVLLYSITIYHSRWFESILMGIRVIPILILVDSHSHSNSHSHILFNSCAIPMGLPWYSHSHWDSQSHLHLYFKGRVKQ